MDKVMPPALQKKFIAFANKYRDCYTDEEWKYVEKYFLSNLNSRCAPNQMMQIYGKMDIHPSAADFYRKQLELIKEIYPIDCNIVEVGAGNFPIFAEELAKDQLKLGKGTVTVYDPVLFETTPKYPNMTLHKEAFTDQTPLTGADIVIGIHPCKATWAILRNAIKNGKLFFVAMCGCDHTPGAEFMDYLDQSPALFQDVTVEEAKRLLKEYPNGTLHITRLKDYPMPYPVLYNKK